MTAKEVNIGRLDSFAKFPAEVSIGYDTFYLVKKDEEYVLIDRFCPHAGGQVIDTGTEFFCPMHGWTFDRKTGECFRFDAPLTTHSVKVVEGELVAVIA